MESRRVVIRLRDARSGATATIRAKDIVSKKESRVLAGGVRLAGR
jgi:hypothetical protein